MKKNRIVVVIEGGLVQTILADDPDGIEAVVLDYDTEGADPGDYTTITQSDGSESDAFVQVEPPDHARISIDEVYQKAREL
jgi:hypothetical protein